MEGGREREGGVGRRGRRESEREGGSGEMEGGREREGEGEREGRRERERRREWGDGGREGEGVKEGKGGREGEEGRERKLGRGGGREKGSDTITAAVECLQKTHQLRFERRVHFSSLQLLPRPLTRHSLVGRVVPRQSYRCKEEGGGEG